jgi:hypothetical protein
VKPACLATCEDSPTIIIGVARTWDWRRTRPSHAPSKDQKPGGSWRSPRWAGSIIGMNVALPEPRADVECVTAIQFWIGDSSEVPFSRAVPIPERKLTATLLR